MSDETATQWATAAGTMRLETEPIRGRMGERVPVEGTRDPRATPQVPLRELARAHAANHAAAEQP